MNSRVPSDNRGMTLIEVLIALVILTVGLLALSQQSMVARQQSLAGEMKSEAAALAQYKFEEFLALEFDSIDSGADTLQGHPMTWTVSGSDPKTVTLTIERRGLLQKSVEDQFITIISSWGR